MPTTICSNCSRPVAYSEEAENIFCVWCGASVNPAPDQEQSPTYSHYRPKKPIPAAAIAVLFVSLIAIVAGIFIYRASRDVEIANKERAASPSKQKVAVAKNREQPERESVPDDKPLTSNDSNQTGPILIGIFFYFVPTFVAVIRKHGSWPAIAILDVLLGWTVVCWIVALVWSFTEVSSREHTHHHFHH
jgi:hypothetical protein